MLAKITQAVDLQAYGPSESRDRLADYTAGGNDIEHIMAAGADAAAIAEFGEHAQDDAVIQSLGNLLLIEKSINRSISNTQYSEKIKSYAQSKFLLTRCQADTAAQLVGVADQITKTVQALDCWPKWTVTDVEARQLFLTKLACRVWDVPVVEEVVPA